MQTLLEILYSCMELKEQPLSDTSVTPPSLNRDLAQFVIIQAPLRLPIAAFVATLASIPSLLHIKTMLRHTLYTHTAIRTVYKFPIIQPSIQFTLAPVTSQRRLF